jgi:uncharacterized protein YjdB
MRRLQWYTLVVGTFAAFGCGSDDTIAPPPPAAPLTVQPSLVTVTIGESTKLLAGAPQEVAGTMQPSEVVWRSANSAVASINASGVVRGMKAGQTRISATWRGSQGYSLVTVIDTRSRGKPTACDVVGVIGKLPRIPKTGPCP